MGSCPRCNRFVRCPDCDRACAEVGLIADELAFWKYQAVWHRAWLVTRPREPDTVDLKEAEIYLERARLAENRERHAHAEPPRETGS